MTIFKNHTNALSIIPIGNGNGHNKNAANHDAGDSGDRIELVVPKGDGDVFESFVRTEQSASSPKERPYNVHQSLLDRLDRHELTITERRCSYDAKRNHVTSNQIVAMGNGSGVPSPPSRGNDSCSETEDLADCFAPVGKQGIVAEVNGSEAELLNGKAPSFGAQKQMVKRRRTRKTNSPDDPAEALTEMSVRGLNLCRYGTINAGLYECVECSKDGAQKTFKNKYSFQRHAFLYHEGQQRKVFPCPVCNKEFSRPDKMKNHWRTTHGGAVVCEVKSDQVPITQITGFQSNQDMDLVQLRLQLQQHHLQQQQQHHQQQNTFDIDHQLREELDKRRQQEQDVLKIRQAVNAITLRQLQQIRFQPLDKSPQFEQRELIPSHQVAELTQRKISNSNLECSVPSQQLLVLSGINGQ